jgi:hypothetical protein
MTALALLCNADKKSETGTNKKEKLFEKYTYVEQLPNVKLLKNGMNAFEVFKILGRKCDWGAAIRNVFVKNKGKDIFADSRWMFYSIKHKQPCLLNVYVEFLKPIDSDFPYVPPLKEMTDAELKQWTVREFEYEYDSYKEEKEKYEKALAQEKKNQQIKKNTVLLPVSYKITPEKEFVKMEFNLEIKNKQDKAITLILAYTHKRTKNSPGFRLPRIIFLEYYKETYVKDWYRVGTRTNLLTSSKMKIPANSSETIRFSLEISKKQIQLLDRSLRIRIACYDIYDGDFQGRLITRPFKLKDLQQKPQTSIQQ